MSLRRVLVAGAFVAGATHSAYAQSVVVAPRAVICVPTNGPVRVVRGTEQCRRAESRLTLAEYLDPPLQAYRLERDRYVQVAESPEQAVESAELGARLQVNGHRLDFYRLDTGERLLTPDEGRAVAEAEVARLRKELGHRTSGRG